MVRTGAAGVVISLVLVASLSAGGAGASAAFGAPIDPDSVLLRVDVQPDGTARWHVEYRLRLDDENDTVAFEDFRRDVERDPATHEREFAELLRPSVRRAENATGREMGLENVTVDVTREALPQRTGIVTYTFTWTGFAAVEGDRLLVGDALSGFYVDRETKLMLTWPDDYHVAATRPEPPVRRSGVAAWNGPVEFADDEPRLVLVAPTSTRSATATPTPDATGGSADGNRRGGERLPVSASPTTLGAAGLAAIAVLGTLGWASRRGIDGGDDTDADEADGEGETGDSLSEELLSNEERVLAVLEDHGGRVRQQVLAEELGWTGPKTSKVVHGMREAGEIEVFRLGRENVVTLPEEKP